MEESIIAEIDRHWSVLESYGFSRQRDGRIICPDKSDPETVWIYSGRDNRRLCDLWHRVFFNIFRIISTECQSCWKVVARPMTLSQLIEIELLQKKMKHPGKCGIETRSYIFGLYGAYFYCDSLNHGKSTYKKVSKMISKMVSPEIPVMLKRGCTEFELHGGSSVRWRVSKKQEQLERSLNKIFIKRLKNNRQSKRAIEKIHRKWIQWAYAHGDPSFREFTDGRDLYPAVKTYHEED
jgi:hypothetical protein